MSETKPWGAMKAFLDAGKNPNRLLGSVERHLLTRTPEYRCTTVLHPSEIVKPDWCHRASWFALHGHPMKVERPNLRLQNIFDEGHAIHAKWQKRFEDMGVLYGQWYCTNCEELVWTLSSRGCPNCEDHYSLQYREVPLVSHPEYRIEGRADGWIESIGEDCLIEIKSIGAGTLRVENPAAFYKANGNAEEAWRDVRRPFKSHILQGNMYLELGRQQVEAGRFPSFPTQIVFLYEFKPNQDVREFQVTADPALVAPILEAAKNIVAAKKPPACNISDGCPKCAQFEEAKTS